MNTSEALKWLFEHQDDSDNDEDLPTLEALLDAEAGPSSSSTIKGARKSSLKETVIKLFKKRNLEVNKISFHLFN
jgi:hypothetical protein